MPALEHILNILYGCYKHINRHNEAYTCMRNLTRTASPFAKYNLPSIETYLHVHSLVYQQVLAH